MIYHSKSHYVKLQKEIINFLPFLPVSSSIAKMIIVGSVKHMFRGYLILAILAVKSKTAKINLPILHTELNRGAGKMENLMSI